MQHFIAMTSMTFAMKAQSLLKSKGYFCEIQRTPKALASGCGYSIRVMGNTEEILSLLKQNRIPWKEVSEPGEEYD